MTPADRKKALATAAALVALSTLPGPVRHALAAAIEELRELRAELDNLKGAKHSDN